MRELESVYEHVRTRVIGLVRDGDTTTMVPACPEWSVHAVLCHLTGICADILDGNLAGTATDEWTANQVNARKNRSTTEVVDEWNDVGPRLAAMMDDFPGRTAEQLIADISTHEHDIRGALDVPDARGSAALMIGVDFIATTFFHIGLAVHRAGPLEVRAGECTWTVGTGAPPPANPDDVLRKVVWEGSGAPSPTTDPVGTVTVNPFEFFRALTGRRSPAQIRSFEWTVDPEPYLPVFGYGPFTPRSTDLLE
jgi:hypothetical protein